MPKRLTYWNQVKYPSNLSAQITDKANYKDSLEKLLLGEYAALHLEKLSGDNNIYSIRVKGKNMADRLLFTWKDGEKDALILAVAEKHNYKEAIKSANRMLLGELNVEGFETFVAAQNIADETLIPTTIPPAFEEVVDYGGRLFSLSEDQRKVVEGGQDAKMPLIISGTAGSGKTVVAQQLLAAVVGLEGATAYYFAPTERLKETMQESISNLADERLTRGRIIITSPADYAGDEIARRGLQVSGLAEFRAWYSKQKASAGVKNLSAEETYYEICIAAAYPTGKYRDVGENQSSLKEMADKDKISKILENYLAQKDVSKFDPNLQELELSAEVKKGLVIVDESQSSSLLSLKMAKSLSENGEIMFIGDSSQSMLSSVSNASFIKSLFREGLSKKSNVTELFWPISYRCPSRVVEASSALLKAKQSITREKSNFRVSNNPDEENKGSCYFYNSSEKVGAIAAKVAERVSTETVIIVPDDEAIRTRAMEIFGTAFVVTAKEFLGMESPNVIMYKCFEKQAPSALSGASAGVELSEKSKIAVNNLFVAMSRAGSSLTICETDAHKNAGLFQKLNLDNLNTDSQAEKSAAETFGSTAESTAEEWREMAIQFIRRGESGSKPAYNIILKNLCDGKETEAKQLFDELKNGINHNAKAKSSQESIIEKEANAVKNNTGRGASKANGKRAPRPLAAPKNHTDNTPPVRNPWSAKNILISLGVFAAAAAVGQFYRTKSSGSVNLEILQACSSEPLGRSSTIIHRLAQEGDVDQLEQYFKKCGPESLIQRDDDIGYTPAHLAVSNGHPNFLRALHRLGGVNAISQQDGQGDAPLHLLAYLRDGFVVKPLTTLSELGVNLSEKNKEGSTLAQLVVVDKSRSDVSNGDIIKLLHKLGGTDTLSEKDERGDGLIHLAARYQKVEVIKTLYELGVNISEKNNDGLTAAHIAAAAGNSDVIKLLYELGRVSLLSEPDRFGNRPIHKAALNGKLTTIKTLSELGVIDNISEKNSEGYTPLDLATNSGHANVRKIISDLIVKKLFSAPSTSPSTTTISNQNIPTPPPLSR